VRLHAGQLQRVLVGLGGLLAGVTGWIVEHAGVLANALVTRLVRLLLHVHGSGLGFVGLELLE